MRRVGWGGSGAVGWVGGGVAMTIACTRLDAPVSA
jgi:hypothetical protein